MNSFQHFTVKKTSLPMPAERLSCLYIFIDLLIKMQYARRVCEKIVFSFRNFLSTWGNRAAETFLMLILPQKGLILQENITPAFH